MSTFVVGITGASGAIYGIRLLEALARHGHEMHVVVSQTGRAIVRDEVGIDLGATPESATAALAAHTRSDTLQVYAERNLHATIASGSVATDGMVVCPCSMKACAAIAHGYADSLITRAADVHIKEGRRLVMVPRETPLSPIHLENLLSLSRLEGVRVVPAMPAFYTGPKTTDDLVDFVVARILDSLSLDVDWSPRWKGPVSSGKT